MLLKWRSAACLKLAFVCIWACRAVSAQEVPAWRLVWSDEFDQSEGSAPDTTVWSYDVGGNGWGNEELQYYTANRLENARIEGGNLVVEAREERYRAKGKDYPYTSARLKTQHSLEWTYGRFEARIKVPYGQGLWPAFWMLGSDFVHVGWPDCGEIDIMENLGREPWTVRSTLHGPGYSGAEGEAAAYSIRNGRLAEQFHIFAVDWEPGRIRASVDNSVYFDVTPSTLGPTKAWVFDHPFFIILNVAVGGTWPGYPDDTTVFPQRMLVDYVRVYERTTALEPALSIIASAGRVELRWPEFFPDARLLRAESFSSSWVPVSLSGALQNDEFVVQADPGFFRLEW
jgi:beta-glucanase (GH16 family)